LRDLLHILFEQEEHDGAVDSNALWNYVQDDPGMHTLLADLLMPKDEVSSGWSRKQNVNPKDHRRVLRDYYKEVLEARIDEQLVKLRTMQKKVSGPEDENELASRIMALQKVASSLNGISLISDFPDIDGEDEMSTDTDTSFGF
jgi:hypothetical protein